MAFERRIDFHVSKLRTKVEDLTGSRDLIKTVWGTGYMFVIPD
jgi:DNA-binding response OmpR family regulator